MRYSTPAKERRPGVAIARAQDIEFGHDLPGELYISQACSRNQASIAYGRCVDIVRGIVVSRHLLLQVRQAVAGVTPTSKEPDLGHSRRGSADGRDWDPLLIQDPQQSGEFNFNRLSLPAIPARQDEDCDIGDVNRCQDPAREYGHAPHRLHRIRGETDDFHPKPAVTPQLRQGMRGLPIGKAGNGQEVDGLIHEVPCGSSLTNRA